MAGVAQRAVRGIVSGSVQGVGFRWFLRENARELAVEGWARNLPNGDVEFVARGDSISVEAFVRAAKKGPPHSAVSGVRLTDAPADTEYMSPFEIKR